MSIEFRCTHCGRLLRTPDGTSGRQAKCPQCGALSTIPQGSSGQDLAPPEPASSPVVSHVESANPYSSPAVEQVRATAPLVRRGFQPTRIDLGDVLSRTWRIYKNNLWKCVGATLFVLVLTYTVVIGVAYTTQDESFVVQRCASNPVQYWQFLAFAWDVGLLS